MYFVKAETELFFSLNSTMYPFRRIKKLQKWFARKCDFFSCSKMAVFFIIFFFSPETFGLFDLAVCYFISKEKENKSYD